MRFLVFITLGSSAVFWISACTDEPPLEQAATNAGVGASNTPEYPRLDQDYAADCSGYTARLRDCGLLSKGPYACLDPVDATGTCVFECLAIASCTILAEAECQGDLPYPLESCFDACSVFECGSGESVPKLGVCDGLPDCSDGSDESACEFTCGSGELYPATYQCDFEVDCQDGSDEVDCESFTCASGEEIAPSWRCDFETDCDDGSDETGCDAFECAATGEALPPDWQCDGEEDCLDGSDEIGCARLMCD